MSLNRPDDSPPVVDDPDLPPEPPEPSLVAASIARAAKAEAEARDAAAASLPPAHAPLVPNSDLDLGPGGIYRVVRGLGRGGMAEVFLARREGSGGFTKQVAIKRMLPFITGPSQEAFARMFLEEAKLTALLDHPNIAHVHALHEHSGALYLVMEYVQGASLRSAISLAHAKGRTFSEGFAVYVVAALAEALHYAHGAKDAEDKPLNIVHRDVTPHNVMLSDEGHVKLLDFGIAASDSETRERTGTGIIKGKLAYMAPEQLEESSGKLDGRADLFALGVILAELLTGRRIFEGSSDTSTMYKVVSTTSDELARALERDLPGSILPVALKALARKREDRFQTGAEFARALRRATTTPHFGPSDAAAEVRELAQLSDAADGHTSAERRRTEDSSRSSAKAPPPAASVAPAASPSASPPPLKLVEFSRSVAAPAGSGTAERRGLEIREALHKPKGATPKVLLVPLLVLAGTAIALVVLLNLFASSVGKGKVEQVKTEAQKRAEEAAREKAQEPILPPKLTFSDAPKPAPAAPTVATPTALPPRSAQRPARRPTAPPPAPVAVPAQPQPQPEQAQAAPVHRRSLAGTSITSFEDDGSAGQPKAAAKVPKGTLISARLTTPADPTSAPCTAAVTADVVVDGQVLVPKGSTIACTSQSSGSRPRVELRCDTLNIPGRGSVTFGGVAMGADQQLGLLVASSGGRNAGDDIRDAALSSAQRLVGGAVPSQAGDVVNTAATTGAGLLRGSSQLQLEPARKGTPFFVYVQQPF